MTNDADGPDAPPSEPEPARRRLPVITRRQRPDVEAEEREVRLAARLAHQFAHLRDERQAQLNMPAVAGGPSATSPTAVRS